MCASGAAIHADAAPASSEVPVNRTSMLHDLRGKPVLYPDDPGLAEQVQRTLHGEEYPCVFPDAFHPETIVDVGAHVGSAALFFRHAYPKARIIAFEPNPGSFALLERNTANEDRLEVHPLAIGAEDGEATLFAGRHSSMQASLVPSEENAADGVRIQVRAISRLLAELGVQRISVLKVDTEGMELPILRALGAALTDVDVVYLEYHSEADRRAIDELLGEHHLLFASRASEPDRGTVTYARRESLARWREETKTARYSFPKGDARVPPRLSVIVPTYGRPERIGALLAHLARQTLPPSAFEVVVVDDGSPTPIALDPAAFPFPLQLLRQENAGPASARNRAIRHARAELLLILNDDAIPRPDLLEVHLAAHAAAGDRVAVMGAFPFTKRSLREPFTRLLAGSNLLFDEPGLRDGALHGWTFFWTCNISLRRSLLDEVGGFDAETFHDAIVEDVELGYRLQQRGVRVLYRADAVCEHDHPLTVDDYFKRALKLGVNVAKMWRKHRDMGILWQRPEVTIQAYLRMAHATCAEGLPHVERFLEELRRWADGARDRVVPREELDRLRDQVRVVSIPPVTRGILTELTGVDPATVVQSGPPAGKLTSIVICSHDALEKTRACLESLRRAADPAHPTELILVDNGSTDGSAEWLAAQPDVQLVRNAENVGAPAARNQALALARGAFVAFLDNDVVVTPGWLRRLLYHAEVNPAVGCVGACADRASHGQTVDYEGPADPAALAAFAERRARAHDRTAKRALTMASFCLLARREVIDRIGGFDERFSPWGFEDDDLTLRAALAGFENRIALDVFVHHDTYVGPKLERHTKLLQQNWRRFAEKYGLGDAVYGDVSGLEAALQRFDRKNLRVALPSAGRGAPAAATSARPPAPAEPAVAADHPLVSVVVIAEGPFEETLRCLTAIREGAAGVAHEVICIDDGTTDETRVALPRLEGLTSLRADAKGGFARAANAGAAVARGRYLAFLHGDAVPLPGWLAPLVELAEADGRVSVAGSRIVTPEGTVESDGVAFAYASPYPLTPIAFGAGAPAEPASDVLEVPAVQSAAMLVRADHFRAGGGLQEAHGADASAAELCLRLTAAGGRVVVARGSAVVHHGRCERMADADAAWLSRGWLGKVPLLDQAGLRERSAPAPRTGRPALSVVVPVRNALGTVAPCLEALSRNLGPEDEIIIADGGSDDGTTEFAVLFARDQRHAARVIPGNAPGGLEEALRGGLHAATRPVTVLFHPVAEPPDGFLDALSALVEQDGAPSSVATPTPPTGACVLGPTALLRAVGQASPGVFLTSDPAPLAAAMAARGGRLGLVEQR